MAHKYNSIITAKNVGLVTIIAAATATIIILNQPTNKLKSKRKRKVAGNAAAGHSAAVDAASSPLDISQLAIIQHDLERRRQEILNEFERSHHKKIPDEMHRAMDYIVNELVLSQCPPQIRLLASQLIQDYAIMQHNIEACDPDPQIIALAKHWLEFDCGDNTALQIEQINHRYALALRSRSIKEFKHLFAWLQAMDASHRERDTIRQNWILRNFQCACLLGKWTQVRSFGEELERVEPESLAANGQQQAPLHPLHLFEYIALKLPNQSANFTQVYYNVERYAPRFDPMLCPPLRFTEWHIKHCATLLTFGFSTTPQTNHDLQQQLAVGKDDDGDGDGNKQRKYTKVPTSSGSRMMFVYGCLVQFPCFWVQIPASNTKMQPVVLTGPWNDTEMELTASYIRRMPQQNSDEKERENGEKEKKKGKLIKVVRSDLRLRLDRKLPFNPNEDSDGDDLKEESNGNGKNMKKTRHSGWHWKGDFEHEEGVLQCYEHDLNNFQFRKNSEWESSALKFTCRTWKIHMVITTPD
mmetsp:Transcript_14018/g.21128  ORF Transcript_14018/g.21128 Transcript_14018/m.21128 type:complete len:526 (-) Transcript_14018:57-1634(-)